LIVDSLNQISFNWNLFAIFVFVIHYAPIKMKKVNILSIFFLICFIGSAQNTIEQKYALTTTVNTYSLATLKLTDPYLSPMPYNGMGIRYQHENRRLLSPDDIHISMINKLSLFGGIAQNPSKSASMTYLGINFAWGMHYHFRPIKGLQLLAGGLWDMDFGFKTISRNVNNPVNMDMATNLNLSGIAMYNFSIRKRELRVQLALQSPIIGCMFIPESGASYYEMFDLGNLTNTTHFSSLHNKRGIRQTLTLDIPFKRSTWRLGISSEALKYTANDMVFKRNDYSLVLGYSYDLFIFSGRKNRAPHNFISTNE